MSVVLPDVIVSVPGITGMLVRRWVLPVPSIPVSPELMTALMFTAPFTSRVPRASPRPACMVSLDLSADKSKETIHAGLGEARGTLDVKGAVNIKAVISSGDTGIEGTGRTHRLTSIPVIPGTETITSGSTTLTVGPDYTITYDTGRITLNTTSDSPTVSYTSYEISTADFSVA